MEGAATNREETVNLYLSKPGVDFRWGDFVEGRVADPEKYSVIVVPSVKLSTLIDEPTDLLKLNIEGVELEVLKEAESKLCNVAEILLEFHNDPDNPANSYAQMQALLREQSFDMVSITEKGKIINPEDIDFGQKIYLHMHFKRKTSVA